MSPLSSQPCCPGDEADAFAALVDQYRTLSSRIGAIEAATTGTVGTGGGIAGPKGDRGDQGAAGPAGPSGSCDCPFSLADFNALKARVGSLETGAGTGTGSLGPYYNAVLADGPVGFWPLCEADDLSNVFYDHSGNGLTGTIDREGVIPACKVLAFTGPPLIHSQPLDHSLFFAQPAVLSGSHNPLLYARVPGVGGVVTDNADGQSIEFWVQVDEKCTYSTVDYQTTSYLHFGGYDNDFDIAMPDYGGSGLNYSYFAEGEPTSGIVGLSGEPTRGTPHQFVYTRKPGGEYRIYVDGALAGSGTRPAGAFSVGTGYLYIGGNPGRGNMLVGSIGYVSIYNRELTAAQIANHYTLGHA
jgi:Concanavalin A-like lectin/glucanases superfamily